MRPVEKKQVGANIILMDKSNHTVLDEYIPYQEAKSPLISNIGSFCSYCEDAYHQNRDLQIEHIQPKGLSKYANLKFKWNNFLLGCATCNGKDNKGNKDVILTDVHLPHRNNTFLSFTYMAGGVIIVNSKLTGLSKTNATNLLNLVGLDKMPSNSNPGDTRWHKRKNDWDLAERYLDKYIKKKCDINTIVDLVRSNGGWSIWFTVFQKYDLVRQALIYKFPGTCTSCFDAQNHYEPIERNPGDIDQV